MNYSFWKKSKGQTIIFFAVFVALFLLYQYHVILFLRPQSIHQWRQTICTSITLNYYEHGMNFFMPEVHNFFSDGGTSGQSYAEFPIIYYFNAALWKIFGVHEFIPRLVNILICLLGTFYLFKLLVKILSPFWAITLTVLLFTSPVIVFYVNNFLVDIPILFICFISAYYFFKYYEFGNSKDIYIFMLLSLFCLLLKPSGGTFFASVSGIFILERLKIVTYEKKIFTAPLRDALLFICVVIIVVAWYSYVFHFNSIHGGTFIQSFYPIWKLNTEQINNILISFFETIFYQFFYPGTIFIFLFLFISIVLFHKKIKKIYIAMTMMLLAGSIAHALLWFQLWDAHDYYMFIFFLPIVFIFISFGNAIKNTCPSIFYSRKTKIIFSFFLFLNIIYCSNNIRMRYGIKATPIPFLATKAEIGLWNWFSWDYDCTRKAYETIEPYNRKLGILPKDLVISIPDKSVCICLYLMNQKGWNEYGNNYFEKDCIEDKLKLGAKYLFLSDTTLIKNSFIKPYTDHKIGQYKNIAIFDLRCSNPGNH